MFDTTYEAAPGRKSVLILDQTAPGVEAVRWADLARRMPVRDMREKRNETHLAELRDVPAVLFLALSNYIALRHGIGTALACRTQTDDREILVCSQAVFGTVLRQTLDSLHGTETKLMSEINQVRELIAYLEVASAT